MKRSSLTHRMWAKVSAYILLAVFACGLFASGAGIALAWSLSVYTDDLNGLKTEAFQSIARSAGDDILRWVLREDYGVAESLAAQKNAEYRVTDSAGAEIWRSAGFGASEGEDRRFAFVYRRSEQTGPGGFTNTNVDYLRTYDTDSALLTDSDYVVEAELTAFERNDEYYWTNLGLDLLWKLRFSVYALALACLVGAVICFVFLMCAAGHRAGREELTPGYLYGVPFDLMTACLVGWCVLVAFAANGWMGYGPGGVLNLLLIPAALLGILLPAVGWCASFAMRVKLGKWWRRTVVFFVLNTLWRILRGIGKLLRSVPLVWKTLLGCLALSLVQFLWLMWFHRDTDMMVLYWLAEKLVLIPLALSLSLMLRRLQKGGEALASGDLAYHTDTGRMLWDFRRHGENLNSIGLGMSRALEEKLKSERLKTELITNVSHDIKTPLTSIVNYVDLLRRCDDSERASEYLEVLDRQSHKLKKLTEDLVEVSKASTGNLEVKPGRLDAGELLRQVMGEYSERLRAAGVEAVLTLPETECFVLADGTLLWRVADNLFSNVCKYALPGTRFYVDVGREAGNVVMSFKNISRDPLNIPAEELMERFVRGDSARGGEGSGLGLNIARSLTELQGGTFSLSVDGDLFKAEIALPERREE